MLALTSNSSAALSTLPQLPHLRPQKLLLAQRLLILLHQQPRASLLPASQQLRVPPGARPSDKLLPKHLRLVCSEAHRPPPWCVSTAPLHQLLLLNHNSSGGCQRCG